MERLATYRASTDHTPLWHSSPPSDSTSQHRHAHLNPRRHTSYHVIGQTLETLEASTFKVGIPWVPSAALRVPRQQVRNIGEFARFGLVSVPTIALESYLEDLETLSNKPRSFSILQVPRYPWVARWSFSLLLSLAIILLGLIPISLTLNHASIISSGVILFVLLLVLISLSVSMEKYRRSSFYAIIYREVIRRRGGDSTSHIGVHSIKAQPIVE